MTTETRGREFGAVVDEFANLVLQMRIAQKRYFKCEPGREKMDALENSKSLERQVDKRLQQMQTAAEQESLF